MFIYNNTWLNSYARHRVFVEVQGVDAPLNMDVSLHKYTFILLIRVRESVRICYSPFMYQFPPHRMTEGDPDVSTLLKA